MYAVQLAREYYFEPLQNTRDFQRLKCENPGRLNTTKQSQKHCIYEAVVFQMFCIFGVFEPRFCRGFRISSCPNAARLKNAQSPRSKARKPWQVQELPKIRQILASLRPWLSNLGICWVILGIFEPARVLAN